jgi:hypothetical protein
MYGTKKVKAKTPETKERNKRRKQLLYAALDFLEAPKPRVSAHQRELSELYSQLIVGSLIRTLGGYMDLPRSKRRAKALGIAVDNSVPDHERKLQRKRLHLNRPAQNRGRDRDGEMLV